MADQTETEPVDGSNEQETPREGAGANGHAPAADAGSGQEPQAVRSPGSDNRSDAATGGKGNLDLVLDIPVQICMELGRTKISIRDLLKLSEGSVVKLERPAGEPLDILVNGCLVARGEVVVANDRFGMRITDIVSTEERVRRLQ